MPFAPLHNHSHYSLLDAACSPADLADAAARSGFPAIALTDRNSLSGIVEFFAACRTAQVHPVAGAELTLEGGFHLTLLVQSNAGYRNLCRLLTRQTREFVPIPLPRLATHADGLVALSGCRHGEIPSLLVEGRSALAAKRASHLAEMFPGRFHIELFHNEPADRLLAQRLAQLADELHLPTVATPNTHYLAESDTRKRQVLASIRTLTLLDETHPEKNTQNGYHWKSLADLRDSFRWRPDALDATVPLALSCKCPILEDAVAP